MDTLGEKALLHHYANIVRSADSAIISRDIGGIITTWNRAAEELFGYRATEVIGKNFALLVPPENRDEIDKIDKIVSRGKPIEAYETIRVRKDGKRIPIIAKISPIRNQNKQIVGMSLFDRDNTLRKKEELVEQFLTRATKVLSSSLNYNYTLRKLAKILVPELADWSSVHIVDSKGIPIQLAVAHIDPKKVAWALSLQKKYGEGERMKDPNNSVVRVIKTGKPELYPTITEKMINESVTKAEDRALIKKLKLRSVIIVPLLSRSGVMGVITLVSSDPNRCYDKNDLKFAEELGRLAGQAIENARLYHEAQAEIKKRKKIEEQLRASKDQLSTILANVADGITVFDEKAKVVFVNQAVAKASGYLNEKGMLNEPLSWQDIYDVRDEMGNPISLLDLPGRKSSLEGVVTEKVVRSINKRTGEDRWAVVSARPIVDNSGKVRGSVSITHDITAQKELERKKDDFISIASHELKTPVTSIKGYIHLLKAKHREFQDSWNFLNKIDLQLNKLTELIEDLLELSRSQSGKIQYSMNKFDLGELVHEVVDDLQTVDTSHKLIFKNGIKKKINGDRERISQVLINLINNAIKYSPKSDKVIVRLTDEGKKVKVSVRDFGIGLDRDERDKIFERFYRVKDQHGKTFPGLGIGLYLSAQIAERHNGKIWVESKKGVGSIFHFELPAIAN